MSRDDTRRAFDDASYREYERKMILFEEGPTTTYFEQLKTAGIELPEPDAVADSEIRTKLWEVLAGMAALRIRLDHTNHLSDRALYAKQWHEILRGETPAIDEIGFTSNVGADAGWRRAGRRTLTRSSCSRRMIPSGGAPCSN